MRVVIFVPEETKVSFLVIWNCKLVEHVLYVCGNGIWVSAKSVDNSSQGVIPVGSFTQQIIDAYSFGTGSLVIYYPDLALSWNDELRYPVSVSVVTESLIWWDRFKSGIFSVYILGKFL